MSITIKGHIARIGDLKKFPNRKGEERATVYLKVIDNHDRPDGHGGYEPDGLTVYSIRFSGGLAERVHASFQTGDAVLIHGRNQRASLNIAPGRDPEPLIKATGTSIGLSVHLKAFAPPTTE